MIAGFGGFGGCRMIARPVAFSPAHIPTIVAHWSGNVATLTNVGAGSASLAVPNRVTSGAGALVQATDARQPFVMSLANNVKALRFSGTLQRDMSTPDVTALRFTGLRGYWAWHMRMPDVVSAGKVLWAQWADGNTTERLQVTSDNITNIIVSVAISAVSFATNAFTVPLATQQAGMFLEVFYDGNEPSAIRIRLYVNGTEIARNGSSIGTIPAVLLAGNGNNLWVGSFNGASNKAFDLAHHYILNDHPTAQQRFNIELNEKPLWAPVVNPRVIGGVDITAIGQWLYLPDDTTGQRSMGLAMWPDKLSAQYAASDTDAYRPLIGRDGAGRRTIMGYGSNMLLPSCAENSSINTYGVAFWMHVSPRALIPFFRPSALTLQPTAGGTRLHMTVRDATLTRTAQVPITNNAWNFVCVEYDNSATGDDRLTVSINGVVQTLVTLGGDTSVIPSTLMTLGAGQCIFLSNTSSSVNPFQDAIGEDFWIFNSKMAGTPAGQLLTPAARTALMNLHPMTNPSRVIGGINITAIGQWFNLDASILSGCGLSQLVDLMGGCSAYQVIDDQRSTLGVDAAGRKILTSDSNNVYLFPLNETNNNINAWGIACWVRIRVNGGGSIFNISTNGTGANFVRCSVTLGVGGTVVMCQLNISAGGPARYDQAGNVSQDVWHFVTVEYDSTAIGDARVTITVDNVVASGSFGGAGTTEMPASLVASTGNGYLLGPSSGAGMSAFDSNINEDYWILNSKMAGASSGQLLTNAARAAMMALHTPTNYSKTIGGVNITALGQWFRLADAVILNGGISQWPDYLGGPSINQQADARRPTLGIDAGGQPTVVFDGTKVLSLPMSSVNNQTAAWGFGVWVRITSNSSPRTILSISSEGTGGATGRKIRCYTDNTGRFITSLFGPTGSGYEGRSCRTPNSSAGLNTWYFVTFEFDGSGATEALRYSVSINNVQQTFTYADVSGSPIGDVIALRAVGGNALIGAETDGLNSTVFPFIGTMGRHMYIFQSKMAAPTYGILTNAARAALYANQPST